MKKIALLTAVLMVLGLASLSAQMMDEASGVTFEIDGEASVVFGIDLDVSGDLGTGFEANTASSSVSIALVSKSSSSKMGDSGTYGSISLKDFKLGIEQNETDGGIVTGAAPGVSAEIVSGPLTVGIYSAPSVSVNKVSAISSEVATAYSGSGGVTIGFAQDPIDLSIELVSENEASSNTAQAYAIELDTSIDVDPISIDVAFAYGFGYASTPIGIGLNTEIALGSLTPYVALDLQSDSGTAYEIGAGVALGVGGDAYVNIDVEYGSTGTIDARVAFEDDGDEVMVPGMDALDLFAAFQINDATAAVAAMSWEFDASATYTSGDIAPYFGFGIDSASVIDLTAGVELSMIANTTFDLKWTTPDVSNDIGEISFTTTISY
jgi:hypothetical protein